MAIQQSLTDSKKSTSRIVSLDVYRGLTIAGMVLVTDPGTYSHVYPQLLHASWTGATAADMIFPSFLFIAGASIPSAIASRIKKGDTKSNIALHMLRRAIILILIGLAVNGFPFYNWHTLRLPGILQRIAICYLFSGLLFLYTDYPSGNRRGSQKSNQSNIIGILIVIILAVYWAMLVLVPVPGFGAGHLDTNGNLPAYIDRAIFGINHLWAYGLTPGVGVTYDPEGILSTIPAIASTLIGVLTGKWLKSNHTDKQKTFWLLATGTALILVALLLKQFLPINKRIWTSSFALLSSGVALVLFGCLYFIVDVKQMRWWILPALILGTNAILAFIFSSVVTSLNDLIHIQHSAKPVSLHEFGNEVFGSTGLSPVNASLVYAIVIVLINVLLILPFYRKKIFLKV